MAYLPDVMKGFASALKTHLVAAGFTTAKVGSEWPPSDVRLQAAKGVPVVAAIHRFTDYKDQLPFEQYETSEQKSIKGTLDGVSLPLGGSVDLTVALEDSEVHAAPVAGDLISCVFRNGDIDLGATYTVQDSDTLNDIAAGLATSIETALPWVSAIAAGSVITITNDGDEDHSDGYNVESNSGSTSDVSVVIKYAVRSVQVNFWCNKLSTKGSLHQSLEQFFARLDRDKGFSLSNGEWVDFCLMRTQPDDSNVDKDLFTDIFLVTLCHWTDITDKKYAVVAPLGEHGPEVVIEGQSVEF